MSQVIVVAPPYSVHICSNQQLGVSYLVVVLPFLGGMRMLLRPACKLGGKYHKVMDESVNIAVTWRTLAKLPRLFRCKKYKKKP